MDWEIVQEGGGICLKTASAEGTEYTEEIFLYQDLPGFLSFENRLVNGSRESFYDITGKISLARYLVEEKFSLSQLKNIFRQILIMEQTLEEYLLEGNGLMVHPDFLFVERGTEKLWGIYHGADADGDVAAFGKLLEYIMDYMPQSDRELVFFVYGMHKLTRGPGCTRRDISAYLGQEETGESALKEAMEESGLASQPSQAGERRPSGGRHPAKSLGKREAGEEDENRPIPFLSAGILLVGIMIPIVLWRAGLFAMPLSFGTDWGKCLAAFAFFLAVSGYGAFRAAGFKKKEVGSVQRDEEKETPGWQLCLIPGKSGCELMPVGKFPFMIGSDGQKSDGELKGAGISGCHLRLVEEAGEIFAIDQESPGGTFHNTRRMVPWQKEALRDGDTLSIGSYEFVVELTSTEYVI